jgi:RNA-splicing ligase RtcB
VGRDAHPGHGAAGIIAEEAGFAYQDLAAVVDTLRRLDLSRPVVSLTPIGNIKG